MIKDIGNVDLGILTSSYLFCLLYIQN